MHKLYFKYGAMGGSKTAQALMCRFNYIQKGFKVLLLKSNLDNRFEADNEKRYVISRIGLKAACLVVDKTDSMQDIYLKNKEKCDVIIIDECHFLTANQVNELKNLTQFVPVLCYGLKTNFKTELFEGSKRLLELAESIQEIKSVCVCGRKATINARKVNGKIATEGAEVQIGGDESYEAMCYWCYTKLKEEK